MFLVFIFAWFVHFFVERVSTFVNKEKKNFNIFFSTQQMEWNIYHTAIIRNLKLTLETTLEKYNITRRYWAMVC